MKHYVARKLINNLLLKLIIPFVSFYLSREGLKFTLVNAAEERSKFRLFNSSFVNFYYLTKRFYRRAVGVTKPLCQSGFIYGGRAQPFCDPQ